MKKYKRLFSETYDITKTSQKLNTMGINDFTISEPKDKYELPIIYFNNMGDLNKIKQFASKHNFDYTVAKDKKSVWMILG